MNKNFIRVGLILLILLVFTNIVSAVDLDSKNRDVQYVKTIIERSKKVVDKLGIKDSSVYKNVTNIVANRYFKLNDIYAKRDSGLLKIKKSELLDSIKNNAILAVQNEKESALYRSHFAFSSDLSLYLSEKQIEIIKDGITYGVVKVTYDSTLDMIPSLKKDEKAQILTWLKEAREFALDAENSDKKHEAFGKYKGKINNYLAKRGYDLVKERAAWYERIKLRDAKKKK